MYTIAYLVSDTEANNMVRNLENVLMGPLPCIINLFKSAHDLALLYFGNTSSC